MIEFSGEFSEKNKNYLLKQNSMVGFLASLVVAIIFGIIIITIAAIYDFWIITIFLIVLVFLIAIATMAPYIQKKKTLNLLLPKKISIDENGNIYFDLDSHTISRSINDIKEIIDTDESYYIKFRFPKVSGFICQKDLLKNGTIEQFEQIYKYKIIHN